MPIYLGTWQVARPLTCRGLCVSRTGGCYRPAKGLFHHGEVLRVDSFTSSIVPVLADAATYIGIIILGHAIMCLVTDATHKNRLS